MLESLWRQEAAAKLKRQIGAVRARLAASHEALRKELGDGRTALTLAVEGRVAGYYGDSHRLRSEVRKQTVRLQEQPDGSEQWRCVQCGALFTSHDELRRHMRDETASKLREEERRLKAQVAQVGREIKAAAQAAESSAMRQQTARAELAAQAARADE